MSEGLGTIGFIGLGVMGRPMAANLLVVSAQLSDEPDDANGIALFLVSAEQPGVIRRPRRLVDCRGAADIGFNGVQIGAEAVLEGGWPLLDKVLDCARAGLAAQMLGAASQAFEITLDYLKTRAQFGQLIGSFQALQHRAAMMFIELELGRSAVEAALAALDQSSPEAPELVSLAKAKLGETFQLVANEMLQMHGGIGMTEEHDAGLYLKSARVAEAMFGNASFHRDRFARLRGY